MNETRNLRNMVIAVLAVIGVGTGGYLLLEQGWSVLDALYMTVITITTIGFGEIHDLSPAGRVFTMALVFCGLGLAAVFATQVAKAIVESGFKNLYGKRKMKERVARLSEHYIVCGYGRIGRAICLKLFEMDLGFVVVDADQDKLARASQRGHLVVEGDAAQDGVLLSARISRAAGIVLCINNDADNINIALAARELNPNIYIAARGSDQAIEYRMLRAGANTVVYPMELGGEQIARLLARQAGLESDILGRDAQAPSVLGYGLRLFRTFEEEAVSVGQAVKDAGAMSAVSLQTADGGDTPSPGPEELVRKGDTLVLLVNESACNTDACVVDDLVAWSDDLLLGIPAIDAEHRVLVRYAEEFQQGVKQGIDPEAVARLFDRLLDYTTRHFAHEEALMHENNYPDVEEHVAEHRRITRLVMELNRDRRYVFPQSIGSFLRQWIIGHIQKTDQGYVGVLRK
ncbi:MAG: hypothetical protein D6E12_07125 [Desulfovibrio sp.]|nr:MAG: hypothetical protein D6E12_07125 [Desulfovibrio sp.]